MIRDYGFSRSLPLATRVLVTVPAAGGVTPEAMRHLDHALRQQDQAWKGTAGLLFAGGLLLRIQRAVFNRFLAQVPVSTQVLQPGPALEPLPEQYPMEAAPGLPLAPIPDQTWPIREALLLRLALENQALGFLERHMQTPLPGQPTFVQRLDSLEGDLQQLGPVPGFSMTVTELLRLPQRRFPGSLLDQLAFARTLFRGLIPAELDQWLDLAGGLLREEGAARLPGPGPAQVLQFQEGGEPERFSPDSAWMPNVVMLAKSSFVWLDQLSKQYGRPITRLDQIPEEELARLAGWGFTCLWLIGVWERSAASRNIKKTMGNPEALASAYSLAEYRIAENLGGEEALANLRSRAWGHGIRLAADMVPNHTGVDSRWVVERPDLFLQTPRPPYPAYNFSGPELSPVPWLSIKIEDGYWNRRDAAVVFQRRDLNTGDTRYIYHGNDGTSMPWNDTAQLDFTREETRHAVKQEILAVARRFPVIRFDAAMTLAKKHYQRLWFPAPGDEGAVPSRAEHGLARERFSELFPEEFWREVVDLIAREAPDTLLLAEAFWLMEGYFVRTLGMHRVYNSAFMNMLKMEDNARYRATLRNVLDFSPEVLTRFVNFLNNPDEKTAVEQFGKGDKYFGVTLMMVTMPGLPMFGHGQVEGYTEQYGMEYAKAYRDEAPDAALVARHQQEIFPVMKHRRVFSSAEHMALFDCRGPGGVNEDVFAYTNRNGGEAGLVLFNNAFSRAEGRIHQSMPVRWTGASTSMSLAQALGLPLDGDALALARDSVSGQWALFSCGDLHEHGLHVRLDGYGRRCFLEFQVVRGELWRKLKGRLGDGLIEDPWREIRKLESQGARQALLAVLDGVAAGDACTRMEALLEALAAAGAGLGLTLRLGPSTFPDPADLGLPKGGYWGGVEALTQQVRVLQALAQVSGLGGAGLEERLFLFEPRPQVAVYLHGAKFGLSPELLRVWEAHDAGVLLGQGGAAAELCALLEDQRVKNLLGVHQAEGHWWLHQEALEALVMLATRLAEGRRRQQARTQGAGAGRKTGSKPETLFKLAEKAAYDYEAFTELLCGPKRKPSPKKPAKKATKAPKK
jgi:glycosidase